MANSLTSMNASYKDFNTYADNLNGQGDVIYNNISSAYSKLGELNTSNGWKGARYDEVVSAFNSMIGDFNAMFKDIQETIPTNLHITGKNIAAFDGQTIDGRAYTSKSISEISKSGTTGLTFDEAQVIETRKILRNKFTNAQSAVDEIGNIANKLKTAGIWSGESYEKYNTKISTYKKTVHDNLESLITNFSDCMKQAKDDFDNLQKAINDSLTIGE